jgi:hypothetical protein
MVSFLKPTDFNFERWPLALAAASICSGGFQFQLGSWRWSEEARLIHTRLPSLWLADLGFIGFSNRRQARFLIHWPYWVSLGRLLSLGRHLASPRGLDSLFHSS